MTATEALMKESRDRLDNNILNHFLEHFLKKYKPKDAHEAFDFEVALHQIVRATYAEAVKPYEKILSAAVQSFSLQSILKP